MRQIKFIYFDIGGVLVIDFSGNNKWTEFKRGLGFNKKTDFIFERIWKENTLRISLDYDVENIVPILKKEAGISLPSSYSMLQDFVNRFDPNTSLAQLVKKASKKYQLGLLTNMYSGMLSQIQKRKIIPQINWNVVIDSSVEGLQKPDPAIYKLAQERANKKASEILFVDNTQENLDTAKIFGWQTLLYNPQKPEESSSELAGILDIN